MNNNSEARHLIDGVSVFCAFDEIVEISKLRENPRNPNTHPSVQIELLAQIIRKTGWRAPITVSNLSGYIVKGHGRLQAAKAAGLKHCPVEYQNFKDEEEEMAALLADNKLAELAEIDVDKLTEIFKDYEFEDLSLTGYSQEEFDELVEVFEAAELLGDLDEVPEEVETRCKLGDIWQLGKHRLMCGDSTSKNDVAILMDGEKADMVFTDPPYNALKSWKKDTARAETRLNPNDWFQNDCMSWEEYAVFLDAVFHNFSGHSVYVCCDYRIYPIILEALAKTPYDLKHCIVWKKNIWGLGKRYRFQHEFIVYGCIEGAPFYGDRSQSDVWDVAVDRTTEHKTPKPVKLPTIAIENSSQTKEIVLDLFGGSGSTLIACEQANRKCYTMELAERYCDLIIQRWENLTGNKAVLLNK